MGVTMTYIVGDATSKTTMTVDIASTGHAVFINFSQYLQNITKNLHQITTKA